MSWVTNANIANDGLHNPVSSFFWNGWDNSSYGALMSDHDKNSCVHSGQSARAPLLVQEHSSKLLNCYLPHESCTDCIHALPVPRASTVPILDSTDGSLLKLLQPSDCVT